MKGREAPKEFYPEFEEKTKSALRDADFRRRKQLRGAFLVFAIYNKNEAFNAEK